MHGIVSVNVNSIVMTSKLSSITVGAKSYDQFGRSNISNADFQFHLNVRQLKVSVKNAKTRLTCTL